jgi:3-phosphoshikimate 1-carboxyvinyltransferase
MNIEQESGLPLRGELRVPGDKSISHRAILLGAVATGSSRTTGVNRGSDVRHSIGVIRRLGIRVGIRNRNGEVEVYQYGGRLREPDGVLYAGDSGTTLRLSLGICASQPFLSVLSGNATLRRRPMGRVIEPLRSMGAWLDGRAQGTLAPVVVRGGALAGIDVALPIASAQTKSAVLLAALAAEGPTSITEPARSRDHTERMLLASGVPLLRSGLTTTVQGACAVAAVDRRMPGDISSAMFLIAAALLVPGSDLTISTVGLNPTRTAALDALARMGADIEWEATEEWTGEPVGAVRVRHSELRGTAVHGDEIPRLIDEIPLLAVVATQADGVTTFQDAAELRVKESDRVQSVVDGLRCVGGRAEALPDGLVVEGPTALQGGVVDSRGDHRIALAFAVAGLVAKKALEVRHWSCVRTSFPEFVDLLREAQRTT